jgi:chromosome segregation ATPase
MMTHNDSGIVFDAKSGISEEEQREILAKINSIAEKNRLSLSESGQDKGRNTSFKAKKSGLKFPLIVNIIAAAALAGGLSLLAFSQGKTYTNVKTGTKVYNSVERALIEEIRKETISLLEAKDREIAQIMSKLEEIDAELFGFGNREFTSDEKAARDRLRTLQEEYRSNLIILQDERSQILENARGKESFIQAQLTSHGGFGSVSRQDAAADELNRLNMEQSQAAAIEAQMGAFFANLNMQIADNNLDEAVGTIKSMRNFINTPAFEALRSIQARKGLYIQAINSFETMIEETKKYQAALNSDNTGANPLTGFQARITQLEQDLAEKDKTIEALSSQGSGASRRLNELQKANSALQSENKQLEKTNNTLQTKNNQLTADLTAQTRSATTLQQSVNTLQQSVNTLQQNVDQLTPRLQQAERDLQAEKAETARLSQTVTERENTIRARDTTISSNENTIRDLQQQNNTLTARINRMQGGLQELLDPNQ